VSPPAPIARDDEFEVEIGVPFTVDFHANDDFGGLQLLPPLSFSSSGCGASFQPVMPSTGTVSGTFATPEAFDACGNISYTVNTVGGPATASIVFVLRRD
jgi:hypothetical protein